MRSTLAAGDAVALGQLPESHAATSIAKDGIAIDVEAERVDTSAFELGTTHAGSDTLDDEVALEFGDGADDGGHGATERTAGVDVLAQ